MKKKLLIFRFEDVLIKIQPGHYYVQNSLWKRLEQLKHDGYYLGLITGLNFENFIKTITKFSEIAKVINSFDRLIQAYQPDHQLDEMLRFAEKNDIKKEEIVYFGSFHSDWKAAKEQSINFIGVINDSNEDLLSNNLSEDEVTYPALLAEFLVHYLKLTEV